MSSLRSHADDESCSVARSDGTPQTGQFLLRAELRLVSIWVLQVVTSSCLATAYIALPMYSQALHLVSELFYPSTDEGSTGECKPDPAARTTVEEMRARKSNWAILRAEDASRRVALSASQD